MIEIDGSMLEGGGSIIRISVGFAALTGEPLRVYNIRAKRRNPGLREQHLEGIRAVARMCEGRLEGDWLGSTEIRFYPGKVRGGRYKVKIRTAGNITLVLQPLMIASLASDKPIEIEFEGGATDAPLAPPVDYLKNVTFRLLERIGYKCSIRCLRRGHYPKGGAIAVARLEPCEELLPLSCVHRGEVLEISGISHCVRLPHHVAERQATEAKKRLLQAGLDSRIRVETYPPEKDPHIAPGSGIVLWANCESGIIGSSSLGEKGKPAERVGQEAAQQLLDELSTGMAIDRHLTDQLIPYLALAEGPSEIGSSELTLHTLTNIELAKRFLGADFQVEGGLRRPAILRVKGKPLRLYKA